MKENSYSSMNEPAERIARLVAGYIRHTLTPAEHDELDDWVNESDDNMQLFEELTDENNINSALLWLEQIQTKDAYKKLLDRGVLKRQRAGRPAGAWVAAATVLVAVTVYMGVHDQSSRPATSTPHQFDGMVAGTDSNAVLLQLADGKVINLLETPMGLIEPAGEQKIQKVNDSTLLYKNGGDKGLQTLTTPAGKLFQVHLSDGTRVWLNAASSISYSGKFTGDERAVMLSGEAYFEVAHNSQRPFKVYMKDSTVVTVLGTRFNVASYVNHTSKTVTLLEGRVTVAAPAGRDITLQPGSQAVVSSGSIRARGVTDMETVMGWKQGLFIFKDASLPQMMDQLKTWFGLSIVYEGTTHQLFTARFSRNTPLEEILKTLELNGHLSFKLKNNTLYVLSR